MERLMFTFELKPGQAEEYERRHREVWPALTRDLYDAGWRNYTLFRRGLQIYAYAECHPDVATAQEAMASSAANREWAEWFTDVIDQLADANGDFFRAAEVWHMDEDAAARSGHESATDS